MSIKYIPRELLDQICCHLNNRRHLLAVAKSCSFLYPVAQRILYRHINIDCLSTTLSVVLTLANNPHIAKYVKVFAMRVDPHAVLFLSFYRQLQRALENMSDLSSLDLFVHSSASWVLQSQKQFTYPRLVHFASSFPLDAHVAGFMAKANALLHLEVDSLPIPSSTNISSIPTNALPHLSCFVGSCEAAQVIVPGRPVESIHLNSGDLTEPVVETLAKSTAHVSILGATTSSRPVALLGSFAQNLSHLVSLRMMTTYNFSDAPDVAFYQNIANALTSLHALQSFELSGMHWSSKQRSPNGEGRIWETKPFCTFISEFTTNDQLDVEFYSDVYFAY